MNAFALFLGLVVFALIVARTRRPRPLPRRLHLKGPIFLGIVGIVEFSSFANRHAMSTGVFWAVVATLLVGGGVLGAIRAFTVKLWTTNNMVVRQGTWLTVGLWLVSLGLHFAADWGIDSMKAPSGVASATLLLYLAITSGIQTAVVFARSSAQRSALDPVDASAGPFINVGWFGTGNPFGSGGSPFGTNAAPFTPHGQADESYGNRPTAVIPTTSEIIDATVVETTDDVGHDDAPPRP